MKLKILDNRGLTMLELMIVVVILGIFFSMVYSFLNFNFMVFNKSKQIQDYDLQARIAMYTITSALEQYETLQLVNGNINYDQGSGPLINFSQNVQDEEQSGDYLYYFCKQNNGLYQLKKRGFIDTVIADNIKNFSVSSDIQNYPNTIKVTIQTVPSNDTTSQGLTLSTFIRLDRHYTPIS